MVGIVRLTSRSLLVNTHVNSLHGYVVCTFQAYMGVN